MSQMLRAAFGDLLKQANMSRRELAHRLDVTEAWIAQLFDESSNPTMNTVERVAAAAGFVVHIEFHKRQIEPVV